MTSFYLCAAAQLLWIAFSIWWVIKRGDEVPLVASLFNFYVISFRFLALLCGWTVPVDITNFGFEPLTVESGFAVQRLAVLGETVMLVSYCLTQRAKLYVGRTMAPLETVGRLYRLILKLVIVCIPGALLCRAAVDMQLERGKSGAFEVSSYLFLFPLALVGLAILLAGVWRAGGMTDFYGRLFGICSLAAIAYLTFGASLRFQFLGWLIAATIILAAGRTLLSKAMLLGIGVVVGAALFAIAGALRSADNPDADLQQDAWQRLVFADDANMLDGFVLLQQVYPKRLGFSYGGEHLDILLRPIPRAWWPDKPVGGYINKLGTITADTGFTLGISPTLYGSFYQEGGIPAIIIFAAVYGFAFGRIVKLTARLLPLTALLIRGCICAALVPLLRGGDLPGIYAWFGMSFWPVALVLLLRRRELFPLRGSASGTTAVDTVASA